MTIFDENGTPDEIFLAFEVSAEALPAEAALLFSNLLFLASQMSMNIDNLSKYMHDVKRIWCEDDE